MRSVTAARFQASRLRSIIDDAWSGRTGLLDAGLGDVFKRTRSGPSEEAAKARIDAIVKYLETIQERVTF